MFEVDKMKHPKNAGNKMGFFWSKRQIYAHTITKPSQTHSNIVCKAKSTNTNIHFAAGKQMILFFSEYQNVNKERGREKKTHSHTQKQQQQRIYIKRTHTNTNCTLINRICFETYAISLDSICMQTHILCVFLCPFLSHTHLCSPLKHDISILNMNDG